MSRVFAIARSFDGGWLVGVSAGVGLAFAAAFLPAQAAFFVLALASAAALVHQLGLRMGMWCLFVATIPLRVPLSVDVVGTTTVFANDLLLLFLVASYLWEHGVGEIVRRSPTFRIGSVLAALAIGGLYTATRLFWGIAFAVHECGQLASFYVAWHTVRSGRHARYTLLAFVIGLLPAVAVGLRQSTMPVREFQVREGFVPAIAWDEAGDPHARVFSTFEHPLHFSHALSIAAGLGAGLLAGTAASGRFLLVMAVGAIAYCNQFTYSIGGILGTVGGLVTALLVMRRRWLAALLPMALVLYVLLAPEAFLVRIENTLSGKNPTSAARLITYQQTIDVLRDHPLLGVGWGSIRTALEHDYRLTREGTVAFTAENYFLERALATGLVGLILTIVLCVLFFRNGRSRAPADPVPWPRGALLAGGVAFYVQAQVIPAADVPSQYILWALLAMAERMRIAARESSPEAPP